uniref:Peroxisome biogenesis protein 12 n=1 Tax=Lygus hesperus TaxID=30085 RepID=A0A0A9XX03_LYGHE
MLLDKELRPTFFELYAEESLLPRLKQILRYALQNALPRVSPSLTHIHQYTDEIFLLITLFLEAHFLHKYDGSFSNNFYGLKQVSVKRGSFIQPLDERSRRLLLLILVLVPYCKDKLDTIYELWGLPFTPDGDESQGYLLSPRNIVLENSISRQPYQQAYACISESTLQHW